MIKNLLLTITLLTSSVALASDETASIHFGGFSHHLNNNKDYNNNNKILAVEYKNVVVGTFDNSFDDQSYLIGYNFHSNWLDLQFGIVTGLVYGYDKDDVSKSVLLWGTNLMPLIFPYVTYTKYDIQPTAGIFGEAATLLFKYKF